jgi:hypothetical protein
MNFLDGLEVEGNTPSYVEATDKTTDSLIHQNKYDATFIHLSSLKGHNHLRSQLGNTAIYIEANKPLKDVRYVAGITYQEMGSLSNRLGLQQMEIQNLDRRYEIGLQAAHMAYSAINNRHASFKPAAVFLPTEEFISTFKQYGTIEIPT